MGERQVCAVPELVYTGCSELGALYHRQPGGWGAYILGAQSWEHFIIIDSQVGGELIYWVLRAGNI